MRDRTAAVGRDAESGAGHVAGLARVVAGARAGARARSSGEWVTPTTSRP